MRLPRTTVAARTSRGALAYCALGAALVLALAVAVGLRTLGGGSTASAGLAPLVESSDGPLVVYSEFAFDRDTLWAADPGEPANRTQLTEVAHAPGYGIAASLSPDGRYVAYTVLPAAGPPELWLFELATGAKRPLATAVDLGPTPLWSPASDAVIARHSDMPEGMEGTFQLVRVGLDGAATEVALGTGLGLFPIGFSPDGDALYYVRLSALGSDLMRVAASGSAVEPVAHLSDGITRDWHLSPDATRLAYLAPTPDAGFAAQVLDLTSGAAGAAVRSASGGSEFNPVWEPNGALTVGRFDGANGTPLRLSVAGAAASAALAELPGADGFDVPLVWSPDGEKLAVRTFAGTSVADPGPSSVVIVGTDGERHALSENADIDIAGWLTAE